MAHPLPGVVVGFLSCRGVFCFGGGFFGFVSFGFLWLGFVWFGFQQYFTDSPLLSFYLSK